MISRSFEKYANSLKQKKYRYKYQRFIAEGEKAVKEFLHGQIPIEKLIALPEWIRENESLLSSYAERIIEVKESEIKKLSSLSSMPSVMIIAEMPKWEIDEDAVKSNFSLVLDGIQDPGNMGTIIRIADWFAIPYVFCSEDCADVFNPKTIQSTMGSIVRVKHIEMDLTSLFKKFSSVPVLGTFLEGENIYSTSFPKNGFIVIGNEAHGISSSLKKFVQRKITIPKFGEAESLNAAIAAGIICSQLRSSQSHHSNL